MKTAVPDFSSGPFAEGMGELFREVCERLHVTDEAGCSKVVEWYGRIGENYEQNYVEARGTTEAPKLYASWDRLEAQAKRCDKTADSIDPDERFEYLYGTATDNLYADPQIRENERQKHTERLRRRHALITLLREEAADCRERANNPGWRTGGGRSDTYKMARGDPVSSLFTDCCKMFEEFRPGKVTSTRGGDFEIVVENMFELVTGSTADESGISLKYHVDKAVEFHNRNVGKTSANPPV